jgi:hypothetical protein
MQMRRRFIGRRGLLIGVVAVAAVALPLATTGDGHGTVFKAARAAAAQQATILYNQTTGKSGTYIQYTDSNGNVTNQSVTSGGGCATPSPSGSPLLGFSAWVYDSGYTTANPTAGVVGAYKQRTGVCSLTPAWAVDNVTSGPNQGGEALDFSVGTNSLVVGQVFTGATLSLQSWNSVTGGVEVELLESQSATASGVSAFASQCFNITTTSTSVSVSTTGAGGANASPVTCPGGAPLGDPTTGFGSIELRVLTAGGSVSVVGPTSTFVMAPQICGGAQAVTSSNDPTYGTVKFTVTDKAAPATCKSYVGFGTDTMPGQQHLKDAYFNTFGAQGQPFGFQLDWGLLPYCTPTPTSTLNPDGTPVPQCEPTQYSIDGGQSWVNQTYCPNATAAQPICTTSKSYTYVTVNGVTYTDIMETWDGLIDIRMRS